MDQLQIWLRHGLNFLIPFVIHRRSIVGYSCPLGPSHGEEATTTPDLFRRVALGNYSGGKTGGNKAAPKKICRQGVDDV